MTDTNWRVKSLGYGGAAEYSGIFSMKEVQNVWPARLHDTLLSEKVLQKEGFS